MSTLTFTLTNPSIANPVSGTYKSPGQIVVDVTNPSIVTESSIDPSFLNINSDNDINLSSIFSSNSVFTAISYTGSSLQLYDANGTIIPSFTKNANGSYPPVKRIVAGKSLVSGSGSGTASGSSSYLIIIIVVLIILFIIGGLIYYFMIYKKNSINNITTSSPASPVSVDLSTSPSPVSPASPASIDLSTSPISPVVPVVSVAPITGGLFNLGE
jgi:preprotein translocase subunit SecG